jgi:F0F1-type ATP synthase assembly protein I
MFAAAVLPFLYLYLLVSVRVSILAPVLIDRGGLQR